MSKHQKMRKGCPAILASPANPKRLDLTVQNIVESDRGLPHSSALRRALGAYAI